MCDVIGLCTLLFYFRHLSDGLGALWCFNGSGSARARVCVCLRKFVEICGNYLGVRL